jgi:multidrug efflux pump subunit AcrA (membrane-fusion protein)
VSAGDTVKQGQVLAQLESPELQSAYRREQSAYEELKSEVARQEILAQKAKLTAQREADQAEIERAAAQRVFERIEKAGVVGVIARNDFEKAQDALKSAEIRGRHATAAAKLETNDIDLQLRSRREQLTRQRLAMDEARRRVDELFVRAPMDGLIGSLAVADRTVVPANAPLMTLVDLTRSRSRSRSRELRPRPRHRHEIRDRRGRHQGGGQARRHLAGSDPQPGPRARALRGRAARGPAAEPARERAAPHRRAAERLVVPRGPSSRRTAASTPT